MTREEGLDTLVSILDDFAVTLASEIAPHVAAEGLTSRLKALRERLALTAGGGDDPPGMERAEHRHPWLNVMRTLDQLVPNWLSDAGQNASDGAIAAIRALASERDRLQGTLATIRNNWQPVSEALSGAGDFYDLQEPVDYVNELQAEITRLQAALEGKVDYEAGWRLFRGRYTHKGAAVAAQDITDAIDAALGKPRT